MPEPRKIIVTLTTDFGHVDPWLGSMKGVLLTMNPNLLLCDLTHEVPKHDVVAGAFALYRAYKDFPNRTIHLAVVDPGVGGPRRPLLVATEDHFFVGPDNGIFSYVYEHEPVLRVYHITADHYFRKPVSETFHGRDIFAPVVAWLATGIESESFGERIEDFEKAPVPVDKLVGDNLIKGEIMAIDRFGNLVTNIQMGTMRDLAKKSGKKHFKVLLAGKEIPILSGGYDHKQPLFAVMGSSGLVEISASSNSAAETLEITARGKEVGVMGE